MFCARLRSSKNMFRRTVKFLRRLRSATTGVNSLGSFVPSHFTAQASTNRFSTALDPGRSRNTLSNCALGRSSGGTGSCGRPVIIPAYLIRCDSPAISSATSSVVPEAESICSLLSEPSNRNQPVDSLLRDHREKLTSRVVLHVLSGYRRLGRSRTLEFFLWAGSLLCFRLDDAVVEFMAEFLGRRKLFDDLKCLFRNVCSVNGTVSPRAVSTCIRFLGRQGRVAEAMSLFEAMEAELNCPPDNLVFNNVLYILCKVSLTDDSIEVALSVFRRIKCPDEYSYSNLLVGLCRSDRHCRALKLFDEMIGANFIPTKTAANVLIGELCKLGAKSAAVEKVPVVGVRRPFDILVPNVKARIGMKPVVDVFWTVWKLGLLPSPFVVDQLILELCHQGMVEQALAILKAIGDKKPISYQRGYMATIRALCRVRQVEEAGDLFERVVSLGLKPNVAVYNSIIHAFCKLGNVEAAEKYFGIMNRMRCEADSETYTVLIHAHCGIQSWEAAYELLLEMIGMGLRPHFGTYSTVDSLLKGKGRTDLSLNLEAKTKAQVLVRHCKAGRLDAAYDTLCTMAKNGVYPPMYVVESLKYAFRSSSKWNLLKQLLDRKVEAAS